MFHLESDEAILGAINAAKDHYVKLRVMPETSAINGLENRMAF
jgi:hypothetical protein